MTPAELLAAMAAQLRTDGAWAHIDPAPTFAADPSRAAATDEPVVADAQRAGARPAVTAVDEALAAVERQQPTLNAFTSVRADAVRAEARAQDAADRDGAPPGPLAGMTLAVKDLFDVEGIVTFAGSVALAAQPPAAADATVVGRLRRAGALLVGATNMDEFAYGFTTENTHYGPTRNPHDPGRVAGGSSGGSAAAVAAGLVSVALGTDTNGSVRIPAAFCGVFGLRPTYGRVPRSGSVLFAPSFDAVGPLARTVRELALVTDVISGADGLDPACVDAAPAPVSSWVQRGISGLRFGRGAGELWDGALPVVLDAADRVAAALGATRRVELADVARARAAAIVITAAEGADQHQALLRERPDIVDPEVRGRFLAGLDVPAIDYLAAQRFRRWWQAHVLAALEAVDVLVLPTAPCPAPNIGQATIEIDGRTLPPGAVLGRFTQPLSFVGLPTLSVPVRGSDGLPIGVQLAGRPGADGALIAAAAHLEALGVVGAVTPVPADPVTGDAPWT